MFLNHVFNGETKMNTKALRTPLFIRHAQPSSWTGSIASLLRRWLELSRQRRALAQLDERLLQDIGINRTDAVHESQRPFWDEPWD